MAFKPKRPGIQRLSESETLRNPQERQEDRAKNGKTCVGCRRYYNYLKPTEKLCVSCKERIR